MASGITTAFWSVTVNNYDERDLVIFQNGYPDYCRQIVHTLEEGENGTPHIQAWVKLQRQQRMSFMRKLFPGAHFKPLTSDEYTHNTKVYAQKKDETTRSASVHTFNDPLHTLESVVKKIGQRMHADYDKFTERYCDVNLMSLRRDVEKDMVAEDFRYAKILVSSTYKAMWKEFGCEILVNIRNTHTHTHTDEKFSQQDENATDSQDSQESPRGDSQECYDDAEDCTDEEEESVSSYVSQSASEESD